MIQVILLLWPILCLADSGMTYFALSVYGVCDKNPLVTLLVTATHPSVVVFLGLLAIPIALVVRGMKSKSLLWLLCIFTAFELYAVVNNVLCLLNAV